MFDKLDEKFDVVSTKGQEIIVPEPIEKTNDAEKARQTLHGLIDKGSEAIDGILHIAKNSDQPRAYEVAGQLIKTISDVAKDLIDVKKKVHDMEKEPGTKINTQNNVFVGSTHELMKMLKNPHQIENIAPNE
jgi:hypothetical protein